MVEIEKSVLGSVRLDSDVWDAVRGMSVSLNQYLRESLLRESVRPRKLSKKAAHVEALKASDPLGAEREDIEHGNMELPSGGSVAIVGAATPVARRATVKSDAYHDRYRGPLLKPGER
jgi:hypothetical protein